MKRSRLAAFTLMTLAALAGAASGENSIANGNGKKTRQFRGVSINLYHLGPTAEEKKAQKDNEESLAVKRSIKEIDLLAGMGCSSINFVLSAKQKDVHAETIAIPWDELPSPTEIEAILKHAKKRGMLVMFMPIVLLEESGSKEWRGVIAPEDWDNWFQSYTTYMTAMAKLARRCDVDVLSVGSELLSTETFRERWVKVIGQVRKEFKKKLTYSANWDHYTVPTFWDQVDYISMNNYNELANKPGVPVEELVKKWGPIKQGILKFVKEQKKPFFFSEVGWHNVQNTVKEPWNYVAEGPIDLPEQKRAYQSFVEAWKDVTTDEFMGAFVWEWVPGMDGATKHGTYSLQNTPALEVVKEWMKGADK